MFANYFNAYGLHNNNMVVATTVQWKYHNGSNISMLLVAMATY
jgi:hypothetical protein